jgi:hypothetical protein
VGEGLPKPYVTALGWSYWRSASTSPSSGKCPVSAFEKTSRPSAITSYCPLPPGIASASKPLAVSSVARLAALSS